MSAQDRQQSDRGEGEAPGLHVYAAEDGTIKFEGGNDPDVIVTTTPEKLKAFILGVKAGEFDHFVEDAAEGGSEGGAEDESEGEAGEEGGTGGGPAAAGA
ncbi:DUF397 domain-containing protein [Streptomyces sp. H27-D2]|uniref:DUF397 domain-containing protein n=1 Tax=Streptomyces sp. H27-D2 TaxID=3046304 RepID=UPI002DB60C78|nr:DUF397 domain-containing protein [Streptomyces sp. H27-D2]MEC4015658.1 DUF397 domain-containing protein [Streptomyces sp. H27-D2]